MKKTIIYIFVAVILAILVYIVRIAFGSAMIGGFFNPPMSKEKMEDSFNENYESLVTVMNYLANSDCESIYISDTTENGKMLIAGKPVEIDNAKVIESINLLKERSYSVITKDGNTISFQRWSNLDNGRGVAYSIDGSDPTLEFLTKLEQLSKPNWYYYEEDFNEWKKRNQR